MAVLTLTGLVLNALAVLAVYMGWRRASRVWVWLSLALLAGSIVVFSAGAVGWEYGLTYALFVPGLLVWLAIAKEHSSKPNKPPAVAPRPLSFAPKKVLSHIGLAFTVLVLQLIFSVLITLSVSRMLPVEYAGQLALTVVVTPVVWGVLSYQLLGRPNRLKSVLQQAAVAACGGVLLVVS
ncbi:hypothetical protein [Salinimonas lutimaris]|uniref:hypothetical protein n=1 Tax=Salinimonas lutimaris TaxID=914153 RepID=UPI0010C00C1E|nr:hypothetical protein [Salinimonas lutimaris]